MSLQALAGGGPPARPPLRLHPTRPLVRRPPAPAHAPQAAAAEFRGKLRAADLDALWTRFSRLQFGWASTELQAGGARAGGAALPTWRAGGGAGAPAGWRRLGAPAAPASPAASACCRTTQAPA